MNVIRAEGAALRTWAVNLEGEQLGRLAVGFVCEHLIEAAIAHSALYGGHTDEELASFLLQAEKAWRAAADA